MKLSIMGKKYNTATSKLLAHRDFGQYKETLYQKRKGEFFLLGEGPRGCKYAQDASYGYKIVPISKAEGENWLKEVLTICNEVSK